MTVAELIEKLKEMPQDMTVEDVDSKIEGVRIKKNYYDEDVVCIE